MTRDEKITEAKRRVAEGETLTAVASDLGCTASCVWKWLHPERTRQMAAESNGRRREQRTAWDREARKNPKYMQSCPSCGGPTGSLKWSSSRVEKCQACRDAERAERTAIIERMWAEGSTVREIGAAFGVDKDAMGTEIAILRKRTDAVLPHRRSPEQVERIRQGWAKVQRYLRDAA